MYRQRPALPAPVIWLGAFWLAAVLQALIGLGNVPLRDWDEGIVARVALEISRSPWPDGLLPTYLGQAYLNKPPGLHLAIATAIRFWGWAGGPAAADLPPEWVVRLVPALASSLLVPLLGLVQLRLRPAHPGAAVASALITLTLLPLARHGRMAMLDGAQLTAMALVWLGMLRAGRTARGALSAGLMAGLGGTLLLLLKAPVALPVLAVALLLRGLDRDLGTRSWRWLLTGLLLGLLPGAAWHLWHLAARGHEALVMWGPQGIGRLLHTVNGNGGGPLVPLTQLLAGGWPWLPLLPFGLARAWRERRQRSGRWTLGLALLAALLVLPLRTQLPWYSLLLWPPFALACGPVLADLARGPQMGRWARRLGWFWGGLGGLLLSASGLALALPGPPPLPAEGLAVVLPAGGGLLAGGLLLARTRNRPGRGVVVVAAGWWFSLMLLFAGPLWNWELSEQPPLTPALQLAAEGGGEPVQLLEGDAQSERPSLHWYLNSASPPLEEETSRWPIHDFRLLARSQDGVQGAGHRCQLEEKGGGGWKLWRCRGQDPHS
jgi:4-amino-4-deoxy-L-arabinose transferase-like glycosyltransferase